ncbi:MAG: tripartite tricarboxylate transporter permease [Deltaproteobacteria bacterium]|nr:tripartite tricarboxylate transporter permease [Deltaproteobacteria bacterium]
MWENLFFGFHTVFNFSTLLLIVVGVTIGIIIGAIPGLTGAMAIALIIPFTFGMDTVRSITLLLAIYCGGIYGGSISAILIRAPGSPASAATIFDGYELAKQGKAVKALKMAVNSSVVGNFISVLLLIFISPQIAHLALKLGPTEIASLIIFSLTIIAYVSGKSIIKGLVSAGIGLFACTIGIDPITATPRLAFGITELERGIALIPQSIGLFAVSEVFIQGEKIFKERVSETKTVAVLPKAENPKDNKVTLKEMWASLRTIIQSGLIGSFLGAIPGVGSPIASFMGYGIGKRFSKHPEKYGTGFIEGVAASEAANNGVVGASLIPLLTLGIPGDLPTAILLGAFLLHGLVPGPLLFKEHPGEVYSLFAAFLCSVVALFFVARQIIKVGHLLTAVPKAVLFPVVLIFCFIGSYAINSSMLDVWIMLIFGLIGYFLEKYGFALAPLLIAFLLGPILESKLRQSVILSGGNVKDFFTSPVSLVLLILTIIVIFQVSYQGLKSMKKNKGR